MWQCKFLCQNQLNKSWRTRHHSSFRGTHLLRSGGSITFLRRTGARKQTKQPSGLSAETSETEESRANVSTFQVFVSTMSPKNASCSILRHCARQHETCLFPCDALCCTRHQGPTTNETRQGLEVERLGVAGLAVASELRCRSDGVANSSFVLPRACRTHWLRFTRLQQDSRSILSNWK